MPTDNPLVNWLVGIAVMLVAAMWFDLRRELNNRHVENVKRFGVLDGKVDLVEASVGAVTAKIERQGTVLEFHGREIDRLRGGR